MKTGTEPIFGTIENQRKFIECYMKGMSDKEMTEVFFCSYSPIQQYRHMLGLPSHGGNGRGGLRKNNERHLNFTGVQYDKDTTTAAGTAADTHSSNYTPQTKRKQQYQD